MGGTVFTILAAAPGVALHLEVAVPARVVASSARRGWPGRPGWRQQERGGACARVRRERRRRPPGKSPGADALGAQVALRRQHHLDIGLRAAWRPAVSVCRRAAEGTPTQKSPIAFTGAPRHGSHTPPSETAPCWRRLQRDARDPSPTYGKGATVREGAKKQQRAKLGLPTEHAPGGRLEAERGPSCQGVQDRGNCKDLPAVASLTFFFSYTMQASAPAMLRMRAATMRQAPAAAPARCVAGGLGAQLRGAMPLSVAAPRAASRSAAGLSLGAPPLRGRLMRCPRSWAPAACTAAAACAPAATLAAVAAA